MRRQVPAMQLRGAAPTVLEVQVQDLLRKPVGQIATSNLLDLLALSEVEEGISGLLQRDLAAFRNRFTQEVVDLPDGKAWDDFIASISAIDAGLIPASFRSLLAIEVERVERSRDGAAELLEGWAATEPLPFLVSDVPVKVQKIPAKAPTKRAASKTRSAKPAPKPVDPDRVRWLTEVLLSSLGRSGDSGLKEIVLIAGVRHQAKGIYPTLAGPEIIAALKQLKGTSRVRYSAGRWSLPGRW